MRRAKHFQRRRPAGLVAKQQSSRRRPIVQYLIERRERPHRRHVHPPALFRRLDGMGTEALHIDSPALAVLGGYWPKFRDTQFTSLFDQHCRARRFDRREQQHRAFCCRLRPHLGVHDQPTNIPLNLRHGRPPLALAPVENQKRVARFKTQDIAEIVRLRAGQLEFGSGGERRIDEQAHARFFAGPIIPVRHPAAPSCLLRARKISPFPMIARPSPQQAVPQPGANLILSILPRRLRPFAVLVRLDKPIGTWLLLWPGLWSVALAAEALPDVRLLALFAAGALVMRSAGCVYNDIVDRDFDARVARTQNRPIASGAISVRTAIAFLILLLALGLVILLHLNIFAIILGAASLLLVFTYPFMKRITYWPQAFLGLTFNWGALLGWTAVEGNLAWPAGLLYAGGIAWTLGYDTIYAHQDKEDDALIGVKSSALALGDKTRPWLWVFYLCAVAGFAAAGALTDIAWPFYAAVGTVALLFIWQASKLKINDPGDCLVKFKLNFWVGAMLFAGIVGARAIG